MTAFSNSSLTTSSAAAKLIAMLERAVSDRDLDALKHAAEQIATHVICAERALDDAAFDVLDQQALVDVAIANQLSPALCAVASLGGNDPLWNSTRRLVATKILESGEQTIEVAQLLADGGDPSGAAVVLMNALPTATDEQAIWARVACDWIAKSGAICDALAKSFAKGSRWKTVLGALDASPWVGGNEIEELAALLAPRCPEAKAIGRWRSTLDERLGGELGSIIGREKLERSRSDVRTRIAGSKVLEKSPNFRVRSGADGRWLVVSHAGVREFSAAIRGDGATVVEQVCESSSVASLLTSTPGVATLMASLGGSRDIAIVERFCSPSFVVRDHWLAVDNVPVRALSAVALALGLRDPVQLAAHDLIDKLLGFGPVELGLTTVAGDAMLGHLLVRPAKPLPSSSLRGAPWLRGRHSEIAAAVDFFRPLFSFDKCVHVSIEVEFGEWTAKAPSVAKSDPAILIVADAQVVVETWPEADRAGFAKAIAAANLGLVAGRSQPERAAHCCALAKRFGETGNLSEIPSFGGAAAEACSKTGFAWARKIGRRVN